MSTTATHRAADRPHHIRRPIVVLGCALAIAAYGQIPALADDRPATVPDTIPGFSIPPGFTVPLPEPVTRAVSGQLVAPITDVVATWTQPGPAGATTPAPSLPSGASAVPVSAPDDAHPVALPPEDDQLQIGHLRMHRPSTITPAAADQINSGAGEVVQGVSDVLSSSGVDPTRSDMVAEQVVGNAAVGGVLGAVAVAPVATAVGAVVGGTLGLVFGIPFLPTGLVVGPVVGTALVASLVAVPAIATGMAVGAAVGYVNGMNTP